MTQPADPKDGLYEFAREIAGVRPTIVTSEHTMDQMFDSLRNQTVVIANGFGNPTVTLDDWKGVPTFNEDRKRLEQAARIVILPDSHAFIVHSIKAQDRGHGSDPDFLINGAMDYEEWGNYYGTNRWTTSTDLKYFAADGHFEFVWEKQR